jgi:hypothetical protein
VYIAHYELLLPVESYVEQHKTYQVHLELNQSSSLTNETIVSVTDQLPIPKGANVTILNLDYKFTEGRCFADTSIISETLRQVLKHITNKFFFISIFIVTIFYAITFILALQRQNPRIRALKKSLNVLNKFNTSPSNNKNVEQVEMRISSRTAAVVRSSTPPLDTNETRSKVTIESHLLQQTTILLNDITCSDESLLNPDGNGQCHSLNTHIDHIDDTNEQMITDESTDAVLLPSTQLHRSQTFDNQPADHEQGVSTSEGTSDDSQTCIEKHNGPKQVSFEIDHRQNRLNHNGERKLSISSVSFDPTLDNENHIRCKLPCPTTRQLLIKFNFSRPSSHLNRWLCCCCYLTKDTNSNCQRSSLPSTIEDEASAILISTASNTNHPTVAARASSSPTPKSVSSSKHSETLKRQLHQHRLKQLRMASTFLLITVSFVLFYLPSILNAELIIKSPLLIYYSFLCTHALNPLIYCFMNPSLRTYVISMFKCCSRRRMGKGKTGATTFFER